MKKLSSYQKLKKRIEELEERQRILIEEPNSEKAQIIKHVHNCKKDSEHLVYFGTHFPVQSEDNKGVFVERDIWPRKNQIVDIKTGKGILSQMTPVTNEMLKERCEFYESHVLLARGSSYMSKNGKIKQGIKKEFGGMMCYFAPKSDL